MLLVSSIILIVIPVRKGSIHTNIRFEFFFIVVIVVIVVVVGDDDDRFIYGSIVIISHDDSGYSSGSFGLEDRISTNIVVRAGSECIFPAPFFLDSLQIFIGSCDGIAVTSCVPTAYDPM